LSHQFIYKWFGVASFIFVFVFTVLGYRLLFKVKLFSVVKTLGYGFFLLIFCSLLIAYSHSFIAVYPHFLEGEIGFYFNRLLTAQIGAAGVAGLLAFSALTTLIIAYNIDFKLPKRQVKPKTLDDNEIEEEDDEIGEEPYYSGNPIRSNETV